MFTQNESIKDTGNGAAGGITYNSIRTNLNHLRSQENKSKPQEFNKINSQQFPIFKGLKEGELEILNRNAVIQRYRKKDYIYLPLDEGQNVYFVRKGNVEIGYLEEDGRELTLDILGCGEIFGSLVGMGFSDGYARALDEVEVCELNRSHFDDFLQKHAQLTYKLLELLALKIGILKNRLEILVFKDIKTRICRQLLALYRKSGDEINGKIRIPLTHMDIARLVGSTRETVTHFLSELKKEGIITYKSRSIYILALNELCKRVN